MPDRALEQHKMHHAIKGDSSDKGSSEPYEYEALIALGSNLGDSFKHLQKAKVALASLGEVVGCSSLYQSSPVGGPEGQPDYINAVLCLKTNLTAHALLKALLEIEQQQGRTRNIRWDARTLDLDMLSINDLCYNSPSLELPHPRMMERAFVLVPLCEIMPMWQHPQSQDYAWDAMLAVGTLGIRRLVHSW